MNKLWINIIIPVIAVIAVGGFFMARVTKNLLPHQMLAPIPNSLEKTKKTAITSEQKEIISSTNDSLQNKIEQIDKSAAISKTPTAKQDAKPATPLKNLETAINDCRKSQDSASCLDEYFREYLKTTETKKILTELDKLQAKDTSIRLFCHEIVHSIGRETFQKTGSISGSFNACDQTCHSGCYHGAMERFLRGSDGAKYGREDRTHLGETELKSKIISACPPGDQVNFRFQCLHGLGHAVVYTAEYNLFKSLAWCDLLTNDWDRNSCWGGAFMENITALDKDKRFLSKTDYHFPCSVIEEKYKNNCYVMQTSRMLEMGLSVNQIVEECKKAGNARQQCIQSLGRDKSNDARVGGYLDVARICASLETEADKESCVRGVSYALADNTWDGKYGFPFCDVFEKDGDKRYCYNITVNYLKNSLVVGKNKVLESCQTFVPSSRICVEEASKLPF